MSKSSTYNYQDEIILLDDEASFNVKALNSTDTINRHLNSKVKLL